MIVYWVYHRRKKYFSAFVTYSSFILAHWVFCLSTEKQKAFFSPNNEIKSAIYKKIKFFLHKLFLLENVSLLNTERCSCLQIVLLGQPESLEGAERGEVGAPVPGKVFSALLSWNSDVDIFGQHLGQLLLQPDVQVGQQRVAAGQNDVSQKSRAQPFVASHDALVNLEK